MVVKMIVGGDSDCCFSVIAVVIVGNSVDVIRGSRKCFSLIRGVCVGGVLSVLG